MRLLLFRPGLLSREYLDDRRVRYASPVTLFVLANVLYFFSPSMSDFNLPFHDQVPDARGAGGQLHSRWTAPLVERKLAARRDATPGYDLSRLAQDYDRERGLVGKVLIIAHVPVMALALALVYWRQRRWFAEHVVVALHLFTFLLLFTQLVVTPLNWLGTSVAWQAPAWFGAAAAWTLVATVLGYLLVACRTAYRSGWIAAVLGMAAVLLGLMFGNLLFYRALQFVITLALA